MSDVDPRLVFWAVWGVGTLVVYTILFHRARKHYLRHHDARARRDQTRAFGYLLVALAAAIGITLALFFRGTGSAALLFAISGGAYFVNGLYAVIDSEPVNGGHEARRQ